MDNSNKKPLSPEQIESLAVQYAETIPFGGILHNTLQVLGSEEEGALQTAGGTDVHRVVAARIHSPDARIVAREVKKGTPDLIQPENNEQGITTALAITEIGRFTLNLIKPAETKEKKHTSEMKHIIKEQMKFDSSYAYAELLISTLKSREDSVTDFVFPDDNQESIVKILMRESGMKRSTAKTTVTRFEKLGITHDVLQDPSNPTSARINTSLPRSHAKEIAGYLNSKKIRKKESGVGTVRMRYEALMQEIIRVSDELVMLGVQPLDYSDLFEVQENYQTLTGSDKDKLRDRAKKIFDHLRNQLNDYVLVDEYKKNNVTHITRKDQYDFAVERIEVHKELSAHGIEVKNLFNEDARNISFEKSIRLTKLFKQKRQELANSTSSDETISAGAERTILVRQ